MSTEKSLFWHLDSSYRKIENLDTADSGALYKRSGTQLVETSTLKPYLLYSVDYTYIIYENNRYRVINNALTEVLPEQDLPTGLTFTDIINGSSNVVTLTAKEKRPIISTETGIFEADINHIFQPKTLIAFPTGVSKKLFIVLPARSMIANGNTLYFSKYNNLFDFTNLPFDNRDAPTSGYTINYAIGLDGEIVDIAYFKSYVFIGTDQAIYRMQYSILNPFAEIIINKSTPPTIEKIYSRGMQSTTFSEIGNFLVFASDIGIYAITVKTDTYSGINAGTPRVEVEELTREANHICSEEEQIILDISSNFRREDSFYALRNDGIIFKANISNQQKNLFFTRRQAGLDETKREYVQVGKVGRFLLSKLGDSYFIEKNTRYPYLADNHLVFGWNDNLHNLKYFHFLDCYENQSNLVLKSTFNIGVNEFDGNFPNIQNNKEYFYWDPVAEEYSVFTIFYQRPISLPDGTQGIRYSIDKTFNNNVFILGERLSQNDINDTDLVNNAEGQKIFITYADMNEYPLRIETVEWEKGITHIDSFFAVIGYGYNGTLQPFIKTMNPDTQDPARLHYFCCESMDITSFSEEGYRQTLTHKLNFRNETKDIIFPTNEWKLYQNLKINLPSGYSGCIVSIELSKQLEQSNDSSSRTT